MKPVRKQEESICTKTQHNSPKTNWFQAEVIETCFCFIIFYVQSFLHANKMEQKHVPCIIHLTWVHLTQKYRYFSRQFSAAEAEMRCAIKCDVLMSAGCQHPIKQAD